MKRTIISIIGVVVLLSMFLTAIPATATGDTTVFADDFGSGYNNVNNVTTWNVPGYDDWNVDSDGNSDDAALIRTGGGGSRPRYLRLRSDDYVEKHNISTAGLTNIHLEYTWGYETDAYGGSNDGDDGDLVVQWRVSGTGPGNWTTVNTHDLPNHSTVASNANSVDAALGASAENTSIDIRFWGDTDEDADRARVDNIVVSGDSGPVGPTVTIDQALGQSDPTSASPIYFDVEFNEGVSGFDNPATDVTFSGAGATTATITPVDTAHYTVAISGMTTSGTVTASIPAGAANSLVDPYLPNSASTSTDNEVTYDYVVPNPTLSDTCGLDIVLVLDMSQSISMAGAVDDVKDAANDFVDAFLPATPSLMAIVSFNTTATTEEGLTDNVTDLHSAINGLSASGYTNWEDALEEATDILTNPPDRPDGQHADLIVIFTDGNPTAYGDGTLDMGGTTALAHAIVAADAAKTSSGPIRIVAVGVAGASADNLIDISGPVVSPPATVDENTDVILSNFDDLADALADIASALCGGTITIHKVIDQDGNMSTDTDRITSGVPVENWQYSLSVSGGSASPTSGYTDNTGTTVAFDISGNPALVDITETMKSGYALVGISVSGHSGYGGSVNPSTNSLEDLEVYPDDIVSVTFYNTPECGECERYNEQTGECEDDPDKDPTADFSASPTTGCAPLNVQFTDTSYNPYGTLSWDWDFDDGGPHSSLQDPNHDFTLPGTYHVELTVSNECGEDTKLMDIIVTATPVATAPPVTLCEDYDQDDLEAAVATAGGGCSVGDATITDNYVANGTYNLTCVSGQCSDSADGIITLNNLPEADFSADSQSGCAPLTVEFTDQSTDAESWDWTFTGGTPDNASGQGPHSITYSVPGTYTVSLTVANPCGDDTETKEQYITVEDCACPDCYEAASQTIISDDSPTTTWVTQWNTGATDPFVAVLAWVHTNWTIDLDYDFSGSGAQWIWESYRPVDPVGGDVVIFENTVTIPDDAINITGTMHITCDNGYEVWLDGTMIGSAQVYDGIVDWQDSDLTESYVNSSGWESVESYNVSAPVLHTGANVFTFECANEQMNDGTQDNNPAGLIFEIQINYCLPVSPAAEITPDPAETCEGEDLQLDGNPSGGTPSYTHAWTGDTTYLSATDVVDPTLSSSAPAGTYDLTYTVTDSNGCSGSDDITVTVHPTPDCTITLDLDSQDGVCSGSTGHSASVPSFMGYPNYSWSVSGDFTNLSGTGSNQITFDAANVTTTGNIHIEVTVEDAQTGCSCTNSADIPVYPNPDCTITLSADSVCEGSTGITASVATAPCGTYLWTLTGDYSNLSGADTDEITFDAGAAGTIHIEVSVNDINYCNCSGSADVTVNPLPDCTITAPDAVCENSTGLTASVTPITGATYAWTLTGDYSNLSGADTDNITFDVGAAGTVNVKVEITTAEDCYCTSNVDVTVNPSPVADAGPDQIIAPTTSIMIGGSPTGSGGTPGYTYSWTPTDGLDFSDIANPIASPAATTTYTVTVTDSNGCTDTDSMTVTVLTTPGGGAPGPDKCYLIVDMLGYRTLVEIDCCTNTTVEECEAYDENLVHLLELEDETLVQCGDCEGCNCYPKIIVMSLSDETIEPPDGMTLVGPLYDFTGYKDIRQEMACNLATYFDPTATVLLNYDPNLLPLGASEPVIGFYSHADNQWVLLPPDTGRVAEVGTATGVTGVFASPCAVLASAPPEETPEPPPANPSPAHFVASGLSITPAEVKSGEAVTISLNVANDGEESGTYTAELLINGSTIDSKIVTLEGGQSQAVSFAVSASEAGTYEASVSGLSGSFTVVKSSMWWIYLIIAAVVIILGLLALRFRRGKAK